MRSERNGSGGKQSCSGVVQGVVVAECKERCVAVQGVAAVAVQGVMALAVKDVWTVVVQGFAAVAVELGISQRFFCTRK
ncbi:hypothetical protein F2Q69_00027271 [Brassica cretica]|uniref:Uncharacterized protein n=1 Tax=Brassica cretica TaxID=69181 RepID=A0A8S9RXQ6_BRACR|nr:hypothetical protein F2Q69_00027271 [Brassica cretica]